MTGPKFRFPGIFPFASFSVHYLYWTTGRRCKREIQFLNTSMREDYHSATLNSACLAFQPLTSMLLKRCIKNLFLARYTTFIQYYKDENDIRVYFEQAKINTPTKIYILRTCKLVILYTSDFFILVLSFLKHYKVL